MFMEQKVVIQKADLELDQFELSSPDDDTRSYWGYCNLTETLAWNMPCVPFSWTCLGLSNTIFLSLLLHLAVVSPDHFTLTGPGEFNLLSKGVLRWLFSLFEERESPALWLVFLFNAQIPRLKMSDLAPLVSGDLINFLSFTASLATAPYSLSLLSSQATLQMWPLHS